MTRRASAGWIWPAILVRPAPAGCFAAPRWVPFAGIALSALGFAWGIAA